MRCPNILPASMATRKMACRILTLSVVLQDVESYVLSNTHRPAVPLAHSQPALMMKTFEPQNAADTSGKSQGPHTNQSPAADKVHELGVLSGSSMPRLYALDDPALESAHVFSRSASWLISFATASPPGKRQQRPTPRR